MKRGDGAFTEFYRWSWVTLGRFIFVINAFLLWLPDKLLRRPEVSGFGTLSVAALRLSILDFLFRWISARGAFY